MEEIYILPGSLDICLLGQTFLEKNEAQIDYREAKLRSNN